MPFQTTSFLAGRADAHLAELASPLVVGSEAGPASYAEVDQGRYRLRALNGSWRGVDRGWELLLLMTGRDGRGCREDRGCRRTLFPPDLGLGRSWLPLTRSRAVHGRGVLAGRLRGLGSLRFRRDLFAPFRAAHLGRPGRGNGGRESLRSFGALRGFASVLPYDGLQLFDRIVEPVGIGNGRDFRDRRVQGDSRSGARCR